MTAPAHAPIVASHFGQLRVFAPSAAPQDGQIASRAAGCSAVQKRHRVARASIFAKHAEHAFSMVGAGVGFGVSPHDGQNGALGSRYAPHSSHFQRLFAFTAFVAEFGCDLPNTAKRITTGTASTSHEPMVPINAPPAAASRSAWLASIKFKPFDASAKYFIHHSDHPASANCKSRPKLLVSTLPLPRPTHPAQSASLNAGAGIFNRRVLDEQTRSLAALRLRLTRRMGELLGEHVEHGGSTSRGASLPKGVSYSQSSRWQALAAVPVTVPD